ncbi:MAG: hypothetical protein PHZ02_01185 [Desulfocapsaceae bacterium]|nr:hypothetical protein [Desulfocapsaceae bacterium]
MRTEIDGAESLIKKSVPTHAKISGFTPGKRVKLVIPNEDTVFSLNFLNAAEIIERNVTNEGKILGLTKYVGKTVYVVEVK